MKLLAAYVLVGDQGKGKEREEEEDEAAAAAGLGSPAFKCTE